MVQLKKNGRSFKAQGSPPILAQTWKRILLQTEYRALFDFSTVLVRTT